MEGDGEAAAGRVAREAARERAGDPREPPPLIYWLQRRLDLEPLQPVGRRREPVGLGVQVDGRPGGHHVPRQRRQIEPPAAHRPARRGAAAGVFDARAQEQVAQEQAGR